MTGFLFVLNLLPVRMKEGVLESEEGCNLHQKTFLINIFSLLQKLAIIDDARCPQMKEIKIPASIALQNLLFECDAMVTLGANMVFWGFLFCMTPVLP